MGNIRAEKASGAKNDRSGLLELVVDGNTLVVAQIDRLSRGLAYGLQLIDDLYLGGVSLYSILDPVKGEN